MRETKQLSREHVNQLCDDLMTMKRGGRLSDAVVVDDYSLEESVEQLQFFANERLLMQDERQLLPTTLRLMAVFMMAKMSQAPDISDAEKAALDELAVGYALINTGEHLAALDVSDAALQVLGQEHNEAIAVRISTEQFRALMAELQQLDRQTAERKPTHAPYHDEFMLFSQSLCSDDKMARLSDVERARLVKSIMVHGSSADEGMFTVEGDDPDHALNALLKKYNLLTHYEENIADIGSSGQYSEEQMSDLNRRLLDVAEVSAGVSAASLLARSSSATFAARGAVVVDAAVTEGKEAERSLTP